MRILFAALIGLVMSVSVNAFDLNEEVYTEGFYFKTLGAIQSENLWQLNALVSEMDNCAENCKKLRSVFIMAFEEMVHEDINKDFIIEFLKTLNFQNFSDDQLVRIQSVFFQLGISINTLNLFSDKQLDLQTEKTICAYKNLLPQIFAETVSCKGKDPQPVSTQTIKDLFNVRPNLNSYLDGSYAQGIRLFMFCRQDREFPCLMLLKDKNDKPVTINKKGDLWSQPSLGMSKRMLPYNVTNGQTPQGVYQMDGVMPAADQQLSFGKYRRVILNFVPKSKGEVNFTFVLPQSHYNQDWWIQSVEARDVGRALFRIHGTGRLNEEPEVPFFPFMPTSGCVAKRENKYGKVEYTDQRELLDMLMKAQGLVPNFENESLIKGLLYVIEIDNKPEPVSLSDLKKLGIF